MNGGLQVGARLDHGGAVPEQRPAPDVQRPHPTQRLRSVGGGEGVGLVGKQDEIWVPTEGIVDFDMRIPHVIDNIDQSQATQQVVGIGARPHPDPRVPPHRERHPSRQPRRVVPHLAGLRQPADLPQPESLPEQPGQAAQGVVDAVDAGHPHRDSGGPQPFNVNSAVLLLVGHHQVGAQRGDGGAVGVLGASHPRDVQACGMGAPVRGADEHAGRSEGDRLRQRRHQRNHPLGRAIQRDIRPEVIQHTPILPAPRKAG